MRGLRILIEEPFAASSNASANWFVTDLGAGFAPELLLSSTTAF
jgi:hypothetical protein